ncbi:MAG: ComEA family DNA-binding protein, partial [Flavisolibacter sp.]
MASQKWIRDYLYFSKRDRLGIFVLLLLIAIIYCVPLLVPGRKIIAPQEVVLLRAAIDSLTRTTRDTARLHPYRKQEREGAALGALFAFDPNTATTDDWRRMGLKEKSILIIEHYRSKGGKFFKPDDLKRIWGLPPGFYERVKDSVRIEAKRPEFKRTFEARPAKNIGLVIINEADSVAWIALPGIGSRLSERIIHYRDKLGGFYKVEQIGETFGLPDSTFQKI